MPAAVEPELEALPITLLPVEPEVTKAEILSAPLPLKAEPVQIYEPVIRNPQPGQHAWLAIRIGGHSFEFHWRGRLMRFLTCEALAILLLVGAVFLGMAHRTPDDPLNMIARVLAIAAAVVAAIVPILFYGLPERVPRNSR